ncbi:MAG: riboflavin biosynthesis protein RibF [Muribaculaceae bacterium]|nr:riboflavin biosynthesis protein RibF [Muribaculaceae bacterium]
MTTAAQAQRASVATVGTFDGVHRGHVFALREFASMARSRGLRALVLTFGAHPMDVVAPGRAPKSLITVQEKLRLIEAVDPSLSVELLRFDADTARMTAAEFLGDIGRRYGVAEFVMGYNNHIGSDRAVASALAAAGLPVRELPQAPHISVSSSMIRAAVACGDVAEASRMFGRLHTVCGTVCHGRQLGRTIGFPTANVEPCDRACLLPARGVYAVEVVLEDGTVHRGMANIGHRPTVDVEGAPLSVEVNIFGLDRDLYGSAIRVGFIDRLRDERPFASVDDLRSQLEADREEALTKKIVL